MAGGSERVVYTALAANIGITASKLGVGISTGSTAMLAEAAHSFADSINQGFLLVSLRLSDNPADEDYPFGYGKERFFWAFLAAIFIFLAGAIFSFYQGFNRFLDPHEHEGAFWPGYLVLGISFVFDTSVFIIAIREVRHRASEIGVSAMGYLRQSSDVTLKTALYEDLAATIGVVIAAGGLLLVQITHDGRYDAIASMVIGVVLIAVAFMLGREARGLLLGAAADLPTRDEIRATLQRHPDVVGVVELLTMQLGYKSVLVTGRIDVRDNLDAAEVEAMLERLGADVKAAVPAVHNIYLEPRARGSSSS
jgi:cation diffusion facilitator family transporter